MKNYEVPVRFSGCIHYFVDADTEEEAMMKAQGLAQEETNLGNLEDIDWDVKNPVDYSDIETEDPDDKKG